MWIILDTLYVNLGISGINYIERVYSGMQLYLEIGPLKRLLH